MLNMKMISLFVNIFLFFHLWSKSLSFYKFDGMLGLAQKDPGAMLILVLLFTFNTFCNLCAYYSAKLL